jgi:NodT family efflux transporter outer membrane factor (OMF) lipoprotein
MCGLLTGCATDHPQFEALTETLPATYSNGAATNVVISVDRWWLNFKDPDLDQLVQQALANNWTLQQAWARLEQAAAAARQAGAGRWPELTVEGSARRAQTLVSQPEPGTITANQFALGLAASYELDLWGRVASLDRAARAEYRATRDDLETAAISLAAGVADAWFALKAQETSLSLLRDQIDVSADYVRLTELRFGKGQATALDVYQQRQQEASLRSLLPQAEASAAVLRHQLALLLGRFPRAELPEPSAQLPDLPPRPALGVPADLLVQRPDVRAALQRLEAADQRVAAAVANRLPTIRLSGGAGYQSTEASDLFDEWIWNLLGNAVGPVIDAGSRRAQADGTRAQARAQAASAAGTVLEAMKDVEDALVQEARQAETVAQQEAELHIAEQTLKQSLERYRKGLIEYLPVLTALNSKQALERELINGRRQLLSYRIQLYRALGGEWTLELTDPAPRGERPPGENGRKDKS